MADELVPPPQTTVSVRLDADLVARLDALAARLACPWQEPRRSVAMRAAIETGLGVMEVAMSRAPERR